MMQRSNLDIINELESRGELKPLIIAGLFPAKVLLHREIYYYVAAKKECGVKMKDILCEIEVAFKVKRAMVYRTIKNLA